jgi:hypothetical protein
MIYVVECKPDEALISLLLPQARRQIMHRSGKPEVLKFVRRVDNTVGMIDEDPSSIQPPLLGQLVESESEPSLGLKRSRFSNNNSVITLSPRLEDWVLTDCRRAGIQPEGYGLPRDSEAFHDMVNQRLDNFSRLISDLRQQSTRLDRLASWLR